MSLHVQSIVSKGSRTLYALKTLKAHGLAGIHALSQCVTRHTDSQYCFMASPKLGGGSTHKDDQDKPQSLFNKAC